MTDLGTRELLRVPLTTVVLTRRLVLIVTLTTVLVLVVVAALAYRIGRSSATHQEWMTGEGQFGARIMSVEVDGWTYGVRDSVPSWIDKRGSTHESGWPDCFRAPVGTTRTVRFAAAEVHVDGLGYRPIVAVDCRI